MQTISGTEASAPIMLTRGVPAAEALPAGLIGECLQAVMTGPDGKGVLQYGHFGGYQPLRQLLAAQYNVGENEVLVGNGSLHLQDLLSALLIKPGDVVLVEQPTYDRAIKTFRRRGAKVIGITLDPDGVNLEEFEEAVKQQVPVFVYTIPDFQNPAGVSTSAAKRQALVEMAERYNFWLIEDVPYRILRYRGENIPLMRDISPKKVLTVSSFSKLISPSLRVGYVVGPQALLDQLKALAEDTILAPVLPTQAAVVEFFKRGYFDSNLASLKALYAPRLDAIVGALKKYLPGVSFAEPEGGFFVSIYLPGTSENLLERAKTAGLVLTDGRSFFADSMPGATVDSSRFVRLPFCALTPEQIDEGIRRLASLVG